MLQLSILSIYSGIWSGFTTIYATSVGNILAFGEDADRLVGLTSTMIGSGEIIGEYAKCYLNI